MEGVGLTVIVNVVGVPGHPLAVGVAVMVEMIGDEVAFIPVNGPIFPVPLAPKPLAVLSFVQLTVDVGVVENVTAVVV